MAFNDLNKVLLMGRLTAKPETRYIPSGQAVCELNIASNRSFRSKDGENKEEVCFTNVTVWGPQAENCQKFLIKGQRVLIEGRLNFQKWETPDGQKRSTLKVTATNVQFMEKPKGSQGSSGQGVPDSVLEAEAVGASAGSDAGVNQDDIPF